MTALDLSAAAARAALASVAPISELDDDDVVERYAGVVWNHLTEPGDAVAGRLVAGLGAAPALREFLIGGMPRVDGLSKQHLVEGYRRWTPRVVPRQLAHAIQLAAASGVRQLSPADTCWPAQLADLGDHAPLALWVRGNPQLVGRLTPSVAIVGARAATSYGEHVANELAAELAGAGLPVVSGAAYGIDGAAHRAALSVGGSTVALLAGGVDRAYPAGHTDLLQRITAGGAVVSEVPCGTTPTKWRFLARNRLIAAAADATIVVEAGQRSGSLNTAGHAAALGRAVGAVPGPITSGASAGCHRMLREYDATCITSAADVRELLGLGGAVPLFDDTFGRTDDHTRVRDALSTRSPRPVDDIARRSGMSPAEVEAILGILHLSGAALRDAHGWRAQPASRQK